MKVPLLSEYIVGIDAASNENAVEPWIFAPIFRACRSTDGITSYVYDNENILIAVVVISSNSLL